MEKNLTDFQIECETCLDEDGACIEANGHTTVFEKPDFKSINDLARKFIETVIKETI